MIIARVDPGQDTFPFPDHFSRIEPAGKQLRPYRIVRPVLSERLHGIFKRLHPRIAQIKNVMFGQQTDAERNRPTGIIVFPRQFDRRGTGPAQPLDRLRTGFQRFFIFLDYRSMMVNPGKILPFTQLEHIVDRQREIADHHHLMPFDFVIGNFHVMIQSQQLDFRIHAFDDGAGTFSVMVGNMVYAQHFLLLLLKKQRHSVKRRFDFFRRHPADPLIIAFDRHMVDHRPLGLNPLNIPHDFCKTGMISAALNRG